MDLTILFEKGIAVGMLIYFIGDKIYFQRNIQKVIENNTIALTRFYEHMRNRR
jgi:hypothetical protein